MSKAWGRAVLVAASAAAACGDNLPADGESAPDAGLSEVTGAAIDRYHPEDGEAVSLARDLSTAEVAAWVPQADGVLRRIDGTGAADGSFAIADVPERPAIIQVGDARVYTAARELDLGADQPGRPGWDNTSVDSILHVDADGMHPWNGSDDLELLAHNVGFYLSGVEDLYLVDEIAAGTTSLAGIDFVGWFPRLDADAGDRLALHQLSGATTDSVEYHRIVTTLELEPVSFAADENSVTGTFAAIEPDASIELDWNAATWLALASQAHPDAWVYQPTFALSAQPSAVAGRTSEPTLLWLGVTSAVQASLAYADPFPASWTRLVEVSMWFGLELAMPGADDTYYVFAEMKSVMTLEDYGGGPVLVALSPPRFLRVNGLNGSAFHRGIGTSPEVSWQPPTIGAPTAYRVEIRRFEGFGDGLLFDTEVASIATEETSLTIPPGILIEGVPHVIVVHAVMRPGSDVAHPERVSLPLAETPAISGMLVP